MVVAGQRAIRARWAAALVTLVGLVAGTLVWFGADGSRLSSATVVVIPPVLGRQITAQNPLLNLDDEMGRLAALLTAALQSPGTERALRRRGATASFRVSQSVAVDTSSGVPAPLVQFTATSSNAVLARRTSTYLVDEARSVLNALQARAAVPTEARASVLQVVSPTRSRVVGITPLRLAASVVLSILVLGWLAVALVHRRLQRRFAPRQMTTRPPAPRRRRTRRAARAPTTAVPRSR